LLIDLFEMWAEYKQNGLPAVHRFRGRQAFKRPLNQAVLSDS